MQQWLQQAKRFARKYEGPIAIAGATAAVLTWAYSNFATANALEGAQTEAKTYTDSLAKAVQNDLQGIKTELQQQRALQERILLKLAR